MSFNFIFYRYIKSLNKNRIDEVKKHLMFILSSLPWRNGRELIQVAEHTSIITELLEKHKSQPIVLEILNIHDERIKTTIQDIIKSSLYKGYVKSFPYTKDLSSLFVSLKKINNDQSMSKSWKRVSLQPIMNMISVLSSSIVMNNTEITEINTSKFPIIKKGLDDFILKLSNIKINNFPLHLLFLREVFLKKINSNIDLYDTAFEFLSRLDYIIKNKPTNDKNPYYEFVNNKDEVHWFWTIDYDYRNVLSSKKYDRDIYFLKDEGLLKNINRYMKLKRLINSKKIFDIKTHDKNFFNEIIEAHNQLDIKPNYSKETKFMVHSFKFVLLALYQSINYYFIFKNIKYNSMFDKLYLMFNGHYKSFINILSKLEYKTISEILKTHEIQLQRYELKKEAIEKLKNLIFKYAEMIRISDDKVVILAAIHYIYNLNEGIGMQIVMILLDLRPLIYTKLINESLKNMANLIGYKYDDPETIKNKMNYGAYYELIKSCLKQNHNWDELLNDKSEEIIIRAIRDTEEELGKEPSLFIKTYYKDIKNDMRYKLNDYEDDELHLFRNVNKSKPGFFSVFSMDERDHFVPSGIKGYFLDSDSKSTFIPPLFRDRKKLKQIVDNYNGNEKKRLELCIQRIANYIGILSDLKESKSTNKQLIEIHHELLLNEVVHFINIISDKNKFYENYCKFMSDLPVKKNFPLTKNDTEKIILLLQSPKNYKLDKNLIL